MKSVDHWIAYYLKLFYWDGMLSWTRRVLCLFYCPVFMIITLLNHSQIFTPRLCYSFSKLYSFWSYLMAYLLIEATGFLDIKGKGHSSFITYLVIYLFIYLSINFFITCLFVLYHSCTSLPSSSPSPFSLPSLSSPTPISSSPVSVQDRAGVTWISPNHSISSYSNLKLNLYYGVMLLYSVIIFHSYWFNKMLIEK